MKNISMFVAGFAFALPIATPVLAQANTAAAAHATTQRCRDAHGHFTHCPPAGGAAHATGGVTRDSHGRCHGANGHFIACPH